MISTTTTDAIHETVKNALGCVQLITESDCYTDTAEGKELFEELADALKVIDILCKTIG